MKEATMPTAKKPGDRPECKDHGEKTVEDKLGTDACEAGEAQFKQTTGSDVSIKNITIRQVMISQPAPFEETGKPTPPRVDGDQWQGIIFAIEAANPGWKYAGAGPNACCCTWA